MSSVLYGLDRSPLAFSLLREWVHCGDDEYSLFQRLLAVSNHREWDSLWSGLPTDADPDSSRENILRHIVEAYGFNVMRRYLGLAGLQEWGAAGLTAYTLGGDQYSSVAFAAGNVGEVIAEYTGQDTTRGFLTGLFGMLGMVPVSNLMARVKPLVTFDGDVTAVSTRVRWEREEIKHDSLTVGAELLERWGFSASIAAAVRGMAYPLLVANGRPLTMLGHLSERMAPMALAEGRAFEFDRVSRKCAETFGLSVSLMDDVAAEARQRMARLVALDSTGARPPLERGRRLMPKRSNPSEPFSMLSH